MAFTVANPLGGDLAFVVDRRRVSDYPIGAARVQQVIEVRHPDGRRPDESSNFVRLTRFGGYDFASLANDLPDAVHVSSASVVISKKAAKALHALRPRPSEWHVENRAFSPFRRLATLANDH